jgi:hypothetical protein
VIKAIKIPLTVASQQPQPQPLLDDDLALGDGPPPPTDMPPPLPLPQSVILPEPKSPPDDGITGEKTPTVGGPVVLKNASPQPEIEPQAVKSAAIVEKGAQTKEPAVVVRKKRGRKLRPKMSSSAKEKRSLPTEARANIQVTAPKPVKRERPYYSGAANADNMNVEEAQQLKRRSPYGKGLTKDLLSALKQYEDLLKSNPSIFNTLLRRDFVWHILRDKAIYLYTRQEWEEKESERVVRVRGVFARQFKQTEWDKVSAEFDVIFGASLRCQFTNAAEACKTNALWDTQTSTIVSADSRANARTRPIERRVETT